VYHKAELAMLQALLSDREEDYDLFFTESDRLNKLLRKAPQSAGREYMKAESARQRMLIWAKKGQYLKAALALKASYTGFEDVIESHPDYFEAYKSMGLIHMAIGALPDSYRGFLSFFGFKGSILQGSEELGIAAEQSRFNAEEARLYLAILDRYGLPSNVSAKAELARFWKDYPGSPIVGLLYADVLLRDREARSAERVIRRAMTESAKDAVLDVTFLHFYLGEALFAQNRFTEALDAYAEYSEERVGEALKVRNNLRVGQTLELTGRRMQAIAWYERARATRDFEEDQAAQRAAENLIERAMDRRDIALLRAHNRFMAGETNAVIDVFTDVYEDAAALPEQRGEAAYRLARVFHTMGDENRAAYWYGVATERPGDELAKWAPWSHYYLAEMATHTGRIDAARHHVREALDYDGRYDFRDGLKRLGKLLQERIEATQIEATQLAVQE